MAGRVSQEKIDEIRDAVNIADYIGQYVALEKRGQNLFGLCPFVPEKTPSFTVTEQKQLFKCFSCSRGGSIFDFVMEYDHLDFIQAVKKVADYANIELDIGTTYHRPENPAVRKQKDILTQVTEFMHHLLVNTDSGHAALDYLHQRGLTDDTIAAYGLGYAPEDGELLVKFLNSKDITRDEQRQTGLFVDRSDGRLASRFIDRVMFPLRNERGETVGFSGRRMSADKTTAKYLNSPETIVFNKRDVLFNLDKAMTSPQTKDELILFEGYMDVIAAYQAGVPNGIASMGTSLTSNQVASIARHAKKVTICYDGDDPGQKAIERALQLFEGTAVDVGVTFLPDHLDPDEFIRAKGKEAFLEQLAVVLTPTAFRLHHLASGVDMHNDHAKLQYIDAALKVVQGVSESVARTVYLQQIAEQTAVPTDVLNQQLTELPVMRANGPATDDEGTFGAPPEPNWPGDTDVPPEMDAGDSVWESVPNQWAGTTSPDTPAVTATHLTRFERAERELLHYAMTDAETALRLKSEPVELMTPDCQRLAHQWLAYLDDVPVTVGLTPNYSAFIDQLDGPSAAFANQVVSVPVPPINGYTFDELVSVVALGDVNVRLSAVRAEMNQAKRLGDKDKQRTLAEQYIALMRQKQSQTS